MSETGPKKFGLFIYPGFEVLDVFGPLEALNVISRSEFGWVYKPAGSGSNGAYIEGITLDVISETAGPITPALKGDVGSVLGQQFVAKYSIDDAPQLDVLLIPGGLGDPLVSDNALKWIANVFPNLQYLITVCTGSHIAARAGILDGLRATSNKQAWSTLSDPKNTWAQKTYWVAKARWVQGSDKIWTTSGVSAGTDGFLAWMRAVYGDDIGEATCKWMEYIVDACADNDPFSEGLQDIEPKN